MARDYLDFGVALLNEGGAVTVRVVASPAGTGAASFMLPFSAVELASFITAVGPPSVATRRIVPAATRVGDVEDYGQRLGSALFTGEVNRLFRESLAMAKAAGRDLRVSLRLSQAPELEGIPWEYLYDEKLGRFVTLSRQTPVVRTLPALDEPPAVPVVAPMRILVMISSPSDLPWLDVERERRLLLATTRDLTDSGHLQIDIINDATLTALQRALLEPYHVFHFIGHGGFDREGAKGLLALEHEDGTADQVSGSRLATLLHDAPYLQLAVLNACEGARTSTSNAFGGVAQSLVRQGLPAVVAMQTAISDRAALVFSHEFYYFLTRGLSIDAAICEVRKAMAISDQAAEWGTPVLLRSGSGQPFDLTAMSATAEPEPEARWESLYDAAKEELALKSTAAIPILEQLVTEKPDYADVTELLAAVMQEPMAVPGAPGATTPPPGAAPPGAPAEAAEAPVEAAEAPVEAAEAPVKAAEAPVEAAPSTTRPQWTDHLTHPLAEATYPDEGVGYPDEGTPPEHGATPGDHRWLRLAVAALAVLALALAGYGAYQWLKPSPPVTPPSQAHPATPPAQAPAATPPAQTHPATPARQTRCGPATELPRVNGVVAPCATTAPAIDGSFADWENVPSFTVDTVVASRPGHNPTPPSGTWRVAWDPEALYVQASVRDAVHSFVDGLAPSAYWVGDGISFEFGPNVRSLSSTSGLRLGRDLHVMMGLSRSGALGSVNPATADPRSGRVLFLAGQAQPGITAAAALTRSGYTIEARIPWSVLRVSAPAPGAVFGFNANISDAIATGTLNSSAARPTSGLGYLVSSNPARSGENQARPGTWRSLVLAA